MYSSKKRNVTSWDTLSPKAGDVSKLAPFRFGRRDLR